MREYLKKAREAKGMSQAEAADKLGMSEIAYEAFENGGFIKDIELSIAIDICKVFDLSIDFVVSEEEKNRMEVEK